MASAAGRKTACYGNRVRLVTISKEGVYMRKFRRFSIEEEMNRMQEELDAVFARFFEKDHVWEPRGLLPAPRRGETGLLESNMRSPIADVYETDNEMVAKIEMPGLSKEDIKIHATTDSVEVKAEKKTESEKADKEKGMYRLERSYSGFYRRFPLPENVDVQNIDADYQDGVLVLRVRKTAEAKKKRIEVKVK